MSATIPHDDSNTFVAPDDDEQEDEDASGIAAFATPDDVTRITDSPIDRMTIDQLTIEQLDAELERIRTKRLEYVTRLEKVTKVRASVRQSNDYVKFSGIAEKAKDKLALAEKRLTEASDMVNKLRLILLQMGESV